MTTDNAIVSVRYFNAFGKPEQDVLVGAGADASDVVSHFATTAAIGFATGGAQGAEQATEPILRSRK